MYAVNMSKMIQIRNVPDALHRKLKARAALEGMSLSDYLLAEVQAVWRDWWVQLRAPKLFDLRMDPFEKADHDSNTYEDWWVRRAYLIVPAQPLVANFLKTFKEFPPSQKPAAFNLDQVMDQLYQTGSH